MIILIQFLLIFSRNNIIKRLQAIQYSGKGYETQNLYIMLSRIDDYQKKVMGVWTKQQKSLEQKRNQCLRKMIFLFSQVTCFLFPFPSVLIEVVSFENNIYLEVPCILVSYGCCKELPQLWGLKQQKCILLHFWRTVCKIKAGLVPSGCSEKFIPSLNPRFWWFADNPWHSLVYSYITPVSVSRIPIAFFPEYITSSLLSLIKPCIMDLGRTWLIQNDLILRSLI